MRLVVFRGHGFSHLEKPTLPGLQTRAGTAPWVRPIEEHLQLLAPPPLFPQDKEAVTVNPGKSVVIDR